MRGEHVQAWTISATGLALTALVGAGRVAEGKHFPTDVIAGGLVGFAVGLIVPHLHLKRGFSITGAVHGDGATVGLEIHL